MKRVYQPIEQSVRRSVYKKNAYTCQLCNLQFDAATIPPIAINNHNEVCTLEIDHIIPQSQGGAHDISNFQALCNRCRSYKANIMRNKIKKHKPSRGVYVFTPPSLAQEVVLLRSKGYSLPYILATGVEALLKQLS